MARQRLMLAAVWLSICVAGRASAADPPLKRAASFFPAELVQRIRANVTKDPWARAVRDRIVAAADPWRRMSDEQLWGLMFGNTIRRSWMVWSNGHCPACKKGVPMYAWRPDALKRPWTMQCPHCGELFPKNDFAKYYASGLDEHHVFDPRRADRSLLFNTEHPDPSDPLHTFGVDDGEGYVEQGHRWRFIGAYLIYGQWKQAVLGGITNLAAAYVVTGDKAYAHKAAVLLDRVADLYPTHDFSKQGVMYEGPPSAGYVSTWHGACEETRIMALAYDQIFAGLEGDDELVAFLSAKAARYGIAAAKGSVADIRRNIESGILRDALVHRDRIYSNYPRTEIAVAVIETVLGWPENRPRVQELLDAMLARATAVDGVTGEKGLAGYSAYTIQGVATLLEQYARMDAGFLPDLLRRHPRLREMYRFHVDTLCLGRYYPNSGDTGAVCAPTDRYVGVAFAREPDLSGASMYSFLWRLYKATGDEAFVQMLYRGNDGRTDHLPYDLFEEDPAAFQRDVRAVIDRHGPEPKLGSVHKQQWHLAILRAGRGGHARAAWLDYDSGGGHGHADAMNLGLYACGLDLLPDFGYPPVQYGGWGAPRSVWYMMSAAHNTVVVDGKDSAGAAGRSTLWADGTGFRAIRASGPGLIGGKQFERTVVLVDLSEEAFYLFDVFRVVGGTEHVKFTHSHFAELTTEGLTLRECDPYGRNTQMRGFRSDPDAKSGWSAVFAVRDRRRLLPENTQVCLRYTDLTARAEAGTCEAWVSVGGFADYEEEWIPRVFLRRRAAEAPLASTFVSVLEPAAGKPASPRILRLAVRTPEGDPYPDGNVAACLELADGRRDVLIAADVENPLGLKPSRSENRVLTVGPGGPLVEAIRTDAELAFVRLDKAGAVERAALCGGRELRAGAGGVRLKTATPFAEIVMAGGRPAVVSGSGEIEQTP